MNRRFLVLFVSVAAITVPSLAHADLHARLVNHLQESTARVDESTLNEESNLTNTLLALAIEQGINPSGPVFHDSAGGVFIVPLDAPPSETGESLTLLFDRTSKTSFFLLLSPDPFTGGSVHIWSEGPTEIIIDARGMYYSPMPTRGTFRVTTAALSNVGERGVADNLLCLARLLGITINPANLETKVSSLVCTVLRGNEIARNLAELALIAGHCFSAVNCLGLCPASNVLCVAGLAKWISCGIAECGGGASVPGAPTLLTPTNGQRVGGTAVTLSWSPVSGATKYQTQLSRDSSFSSPITGNEHASTSARWTGFANDGRTWYWRARAGNGQGWSAWSASRHFINGTTSTVPAPPSLLSPVNGARVPGTSVTLSWFSVSGATRYQTQLSRDPSFSNPINGREFSSTSVRWVGFANDGSRWYWRARAGNASGWSQWSSSRHFINGP